jgi:hypothetical protein
MFSFIGTVFDTVVNWVSDNAGEAVAAVASTAIKGAVSGAVIGAAAAAIRGDDILQGALKGTAYGGIAGGVFSTVGQLSGIESFSAESQLAGIGKSPDSQDMITDNLKGDTTINYDYEGKQGVESSNASSKPVFSSAPKVTLNQEKPFYKTDEVSKVLAGIGQGLATGAAGYLSADKEAESRLDELKFREDLKQKGIAANQPGGILTAQTANIQVPDWWDRHLTAREGVANGTT